MGQDTKATRIKARAARVLASEPERASFPKALEGAIRQAGAAYLAAIYGLDQTIEQVNVRLHRMQPPKPGKISVRFYRIRRWESIEFDGVVDRVPVPVKWFKIRARGESPVASVQAMAQPKYWNVRLRWNRHSLAEQRARGFDFVYNDGKTRPLLEDLQRLLELRRTLRRRFTASWRGALRAWEQVERASAAIHAKAQKETPKVDFLVYDNAEHLREIARARKAEDRLRAAPPKQSGG